jgi:hypothetical protein
MGRLDGNIFKALTNFLITSGILVSFGEIMPKISSLKVLL